MPDYIQLLESKLSPNQKQALNAMTDVARARGITVFLTGGAVRDIVSGASVRDLDITVQANPLKFKKDLEKAGFAITGEHEPSQTVYLRFDKQARVEISASRTENFPKPARPEYKPAGILEDLRRRDFTANAMALSLNEGSWGLMLDPLNGMADISSRQLRLVGNYGFLEDPVRMVRATRLISRTGWEMEERTKARYDNAKSEGVISAITAVQRGYELEEIAYEEEPLQVMKALETEGWMEHLSPAWNSRSVDAQGLERLHERLVQLLMAGLHPDPSAAQFRLLTAKLSSSHLAALKRLFVRSDLLKQAQALDEDAKKILQQISAKDAAKPSQLWKLLHSAKQDAVLWLFFTGKGVTIQNRFENFFTKWPEARQKIPNAILQDMRILPDVEGYAELLDKLTFAFMDGELPNEEAIRKFAEPYSPPAPPPPVIVRRARAVKRVVDPKGKAKGKKAAKKAEEAAEEISLAAEANGVAPGPVAELAAASPTAKAAGGKGASAKTVVAEPLAAKSVSKAPTKVAEKPGASKQVAKAEALPAKAAAPEKKKPESSKLAAGKPVAKGASGAKNGSKSTTVIKTAKVTKKANGAVKSGAKASHTEATSRTKKPAKSSARTHVSAKPAHKAVTRKTSAFSAKKVGKHAVKPAAKKATAPSRKKSSTKPVMKSKGKASAKTSGKKKSGR